MREITLIYAPVSAEPRPRCMPCLFFLPFYGASIFPCRDDMSEACKAASPPSMTEDIFIPDEPPSPRPGHQPFPVALFTETYVK